MLEWKKSALFEFILFPCFVQKNERFAFFLKSIFLLISHIYKLKLQPIGWKLCVYSNSPLIA